MKVLVLLIIGIMPLTLLAQNKEEQQIIKALNDQKNGWNKGNLEAFMATYWKNDSLMFVGKSGITYGWQNTFNNYKKPTPIPPGWGNSISKCSI